MSDESSMVGVVVHLDRAGKAECGAKDATHSVVWSERDSVDCWRCLQRMNKQIESAYAALRAVESAKNLAVESAARLAVAQWDATEWRERAEAAEAERDQLLASRTEWRDRVNAEAQTLWRSAVAGRDHAMREACARGRKLEALEAERDADRREAESAKGLAAEAEREAEEWRRLHDLNAQSRGRLAAAVLLAIGKAEVLAHGPMSDDAIAAAVKDAVDSARGRGRFEADAAAAVDDDDETVLRAIATLTTGMDELRAELRAMKGE